VVCWTCGSSVERSQIEATVERLRDQQSETVAELNDVESTLGERKEQKRAAEEQRDRRSELEADVEGLEDELDRRRERIESLKDRRERLTADVEALEVTVEDSETGDFDEVLALHREANQLEFEIERLESDLEDVEAEIASIESQVERADALREEREELLAELTDRRTKIEQIESAAVEQFNDHMDAILDVLGYENIDRIWIERVERTVHDGREQSERVDFDLHVVRSTEGGTAYEDSVRHLSESEREVTGLIFALAGYLVHDLHESVPFMLLDSWRPSTPTASPTSSTTSRTTRTTSWWHCSTRTPRRSRTNTPASPTSEPLRMTDSRDDRPSSKVARLIADYELDGLGDDLRGAVDRRGRRTNESAGPRGPVQPAAGGGGVARRRDACPRTGRRDDVRGPHGRRRQPGVRTDTRTRLRRNGVDVDALESAFVTYQAVRSYLQSWRDAEYREYSDSEKLRKDRETIERLSNRALSVTEDRVEKLRETGRLDLPEFSVFLDLRVLCQRCETQYDVSDLLERGGCDCTNV